jgi:hypothetical protein
MEKINMYAGLRWERQKERDDKEYLDVVGKIMLNVSWRDRIWWY